MGTAQGGGPRLEAIDQRGQTGLKCSKLEAALVSGKTGHVHRGRGLKEEQAAKANPRDERTGNEQKMQEEN